MIKGRMSRRMFSCIELNPCITKRRLEVADAAVGRVRPAQVHDLEAVELIELPETFIAHFGAREVQLLEVC